MEKINVGDLKKGMRYSSHVYFDDGKYMLLSAGNPIGEYELRALLKWEIPFVKTAGRLLMEGEVIENEPLKLEDFEELEELEELGESDDDILIDSEEDSGALSFQQSEAFKEAIFSLPEVLLSGEIYYEYEGVIQELANIFSFLKDGKTIKSSYINPLAMRVKTMANEHSAECVSFILSGKAENDSMAVEAVNIALLCVIITEFLNLDIERQMDIIIGALLHDIGMMRIPKSILLKQTPLSETEKQTIMAHTAYAYKYIVEYLQYSDVLGKSIMEHHERWDGKGYPNGISNIDIDIGARVIAVADAFVAMLNPRTYREPILGYQAMKNLLADNARRFDPNIIKAMVQSVGIYPIGSIVMLNDSSLARVTKTAMDAPLRPIVEVILDEKGKLLKEKERICLNLKSEKRLFIVKAIDPRTYEYKKAGRQ